MPPVTRKSKYGKYLLVLHFDPAHPQGHGLSAKCEQPLDNLQSKFGYCMTAQTFNIANCKRDGVTDK